MSNAPDFTHFALLGGYVKWTDCEGEWSYLLWATT
jgi:hypothetical protein